MDLPWTRKINAHSSRRLVLPPVRRSACHDDSQYDGSQRYIDQNIDFIYTSREDAPRRCRTATRRWQTLKFASPSGSGIATRCGAITWLGGVNPSAAIGTSLVPSSYCARPCEDALDAGAFVSTAPLLCRSHADGVALLRTYHRPLPLPSRPYPRARILHDSTLEEVGGHTAPRAGCGML